MKNKIIWAVDPTQDVQETKKIVTEMKTWAKELQSEILPIAVISQFPSSSAFVNSLKTNLSMQELSQRALKKYLKKMNLGDCLPPKIVFTTSLSNRKKALLLAEEAEKQSATLIFANTQAKPAWRRFRLGGFAETLIAISKIPVMLFNSTALPSKKLSPVLFPTDFSSYSKNALQKLMPWAKAFDAKILIYNRIEDPRVYSSELAGFYQYPIDSESFYKHTRKAMQASADKLLRSCKQQGVLAMSLIEQDKKSLAEDIVRAAAKNKASLIALSSTSGRAAQVLIGSVARDVLLLAKCPVLVLFRPQKPKQKHIRSRIAENTTAVLTPGLSHPEVHSTR